MSDRTKQYIEKWLFVWIVGFIIACLVALQTLKADNARVTKIEEKADKNDDGVVDIKEHEAWEEHVEEIKENE